MFQFQTEMKKPLLFLVALVFTIGCSASDKIEWIRTTNENAWNDNNPASFDNREYSGFSVVGLIPLSNG